MASERSIIFSSIDSPERSSGNAEGGDGGDGDLDGVGEGTMRVGVGGGVVRESSEVYH